MESFGLYILHGQETAQEPKIVKKPTKRYAKLIFLLLISFFIATCLLIYISNNLNHSITPIMISGLIPPKSKPIPFEIIPISQDIEIQMTQWWKEGGSNSVSIVQPKTALVVRQAHLYRKYMKEDFNGGPGRGCPPSLKGAC